MPTSVIALVEVEWWANDNTKDGGVVPYYRSCDLCYGTAADDVHAGKEVKDFRRFWREMPTETTSGLTICEHCLDAYLVGCP